MARRDEQSIQAEVIYAGECAQHEYGSFAIPIFQSSIFVNRNDGEYDGIRLCPTRSCK